MATAPQTTPTNENVNARYHAGLETQFIREAESEFLPFVVYTYGDEYTVNWHHRKLAKLLEAWARGEIPRLLIHMPPRHGKTEQASIRLPAWIFGRDPSADMIVCTRDDRYARKLSTKTKRVINSEEYRRVFARYDIRDLEDVDEEHTNVKIPKKRVASDEREEWRNTAKEWEIVEHGGHYEVFGAGQGISGAGGEYIIVEDPYPSRKKAESETFRETINNWYTDDVYERRSDGDARILVIHTRWHQNDLSGYLQRQSDEIPEADDWVVINLAGLRLDDTDVAYGTGDLEIGEIAERLNFDLNDPRDVGGALWPEKRGERVYRAAQKSRPRKFWSLHQQQPQPPGGQILKQEWLEETYEDIDTVKGEWFWTCDPKHGSKEKDSSRAVIELWFQPANEPGRVYLIDQVKGLWSQAETEDVIRYLAGLEPGDDKPNDEYTERVDDFEGLSYQRRTWWRRASYKGIENEGDGPGIKNHLSGEVSGLDLIEPWAGKEQRARDVETYFRSGDVRSPPKDRYSWVASWRAELSTFPGGDHDDQVDTTVYAVDYALGTRDEDDDESPGFEGGEHYLERAYGNE